MKKISIILLILLVPLFYRQKSISSGTPGIVRKAAITNEAFNANDLSTGTKSSSFTSGNFTIKATSSKNVEVAKKSASYGGISFSKVLKLKGGGSSSYRNITFETSGAAVITAYMIPNNSSKPVVAALNSGSNTLQTSTVNGSSITEVIFTVTSAGTYYICSQANGLNIFYVSVIGSGSSSGTTTTQSTTTKSSTTTKTTTKTTTTTASSSNAIYASSNGNGSGTYSNPMSISNAISNASAGKTIYLLAGTYNLSSMLTLSKNGTSSNKINLIAYNNGNVILDFSGQSTGSSNRGLFVSGDYWYIKGITVKNAGDNGYFVCGNYNTFELCVADSNRDSGFQISREKSSLSNMSDWPSYNKFFNCTSKNNCDPDNGEDADGFAPKLTCGPGNYFYGCIANNNVDDGWDMYAKSETGPIGQVTIENCIAYRNGQTQSGEMTDGSDGNGFKLGGGGVGTAHIVKNCISFENKAHGFTDNNNPANLTISNCTSFNNSRNGGKANFQFDRAGSGSTYSGLLSYFTSGSVGSDKFVGKISNSIYYNSSKWYQVSSSTTVSKNGVGTVISKPSSSIFNSLSTPSISFNPHTGWRTSSGAINMGGLLKVTNSSYTKYGASGLSS